MADGRWPMADGRVRAVGFCNASAQHLPQLANQTGVTPAVNQVELHPYFTQPGLRTAHAAAGITTQAWSPFGGVRSWRPDPERTQSPLEDPVVVVAIAGELGRTPAQVLLRWHLLRG
jgi:2,5-diketo-D-gluconate reductase A